MKCKEFERLNQGGMSMKDYEQKFWELSKFASYMILDKAAKTQWFLNGLNEEIAFCILRAAYSTYRSARDAALEAERQRDL